MTSAIDTRQSAYRTRLIDGMATALTERAYHDVTIADIVRHARTSRRTFYQQFRDRDQCYFALLRSVQRQMLADVTLAVDATAGWRTQIEQAVTAYFAAVSANPAVIRSWVRDLPSLGDPSVTGRGRPREQFATLLVDFSQNPALRAAGIRPVTPDVARFVIGGIGELTAEVVETGRPAADLFDVTVASVAALVGPSAGVPPL